MGKNNILLLRVKDLLSQINALVDEIVQSEQTPLSVLKLSTRAENSLTRRGITSIEQLTELELDELLRIRNMGKTTAKEISDKIKEYGLQGWEI